MRGFLLFVIVASVEADDSCFGTSPKYDSQCTKITTEKSCDSQFACEWGDKTKAQCFAKDAGDPTMKEHCKTLTSSTTCNAQIACEWRSVADITIWIQSVDASVKGLATAKSTIPPTIKVTGHSEPWAHHDHQQMDVEKLSAVLSAWQAKYALPEEAVSGMRSLVAVETTEFKSKHLVINSGESTITEIAIGGRNYNGQVDVAFVFGGVSSTLAKKANSASCSHHNCLSPAHGGSNCDCEVDGAYMHSGNGCGDIGINCAATFAWRSHRSLTTAEVDAVQKDLRYTMYAKMYAEAVLLTNEMRNGRSMVVV